MRFKAGYMGVCVVTLALLGGIAFGFIGNIDHENTTERGYRSIADATGLFNASPDKIYTDYIPNTNYTGWTPGSVSFTPTTTANPFYVIRVPGTSTDLEVDLADYETTQLTHSFQLPYIVDGYNIKLRDLLTDKSIDISMVQNLKIDLTYAGYLDYSYDAGYGSIQYASYPKALVQANPGNMGVYDGNMEYTTIVADFSDPTNPYEATYTFNELQFYFVNPRNGNSPGFALTFPDYLTSVNTGGVSALPGYWTTGAPTTTYKQIWLEVNSLNGVVTCYSYENGITTTEFTSTIDDCTIGWIGDASSYARYINASASPSTIFPNWMTGWNNMPDYTGGGIPYDNTIQISYDVGAIGDYVKISNGFSLPVGESTEWSNGYDNHSLDIVMNGAGSLSASSTYTIKFIDGADSVTTVNVSNDAITIGGVSYGSWDSYVIRGSTEGVYFIPITNFDNFQYYTLGTPVKIMDLNGGDIVKVEISGTAPRFSIENTEVWMDQYGVVMNGPDLNLRSYFPVSSYPVLSLRLKDFTVFGSSITVNGVTYQIDGEFIVVPAEDPEGDASRYRLKELTVIWEDGTTSLSVGSTEIYSGATVDNEVSMAGAWYFTASALEGYDYTTTKMDWDVGHWGLNTTQFIVVYEGLLIAGALIFRKSGGKALDYIVLAFAGFTGLIIV